MAGLAVAKQELRKRISKTLLEVPTESIRDQTNNALRQFFAMREYQTAKTLSVYLSMPGQEISTAPIVYNALSQGKSVFVPYTYKRKDNACGVEQPASLMDMVELKSADDFESLRRDKWGIPTPTKDSVANRRNCFGGLGISNGSVKSLETETRLLDLVIMPGVAFDHKLGRLGHGKGFYDFFLTRYQQCCELTTETKMPFLVGLALVEQILPKEDTVPTDTSDWRLNALITGDGSLIRAENPP